MRINTNMAALNAWRTMTNNGGNLQKSLERLASGYRLNRAADDAAGLAVSEKMNAQIRGLGMATRNTQDAISLVQTAEGGAAKVQEMMQRMRELAVQAGSDTLQDSDRAKLQEEFAALQAEIDRTADTVTFNGRKLINGESGDLATLTSGTGKIGNLRASGLLSTYSGTTNYSVNVTATAVAQVQVAHAQVEDTALDLTFNSTDVLETKFGGAGTLDSASMTFAQNGKSITIAFNATDTAATGAAAGTAVSDLTAGQFINYVNSKAESAGMDMRIELTAATGGNFRINSNVEGTAGVVTVAETGFDDGTDNTAGTADDATFGFSTTDGTAAANATFTVTEVSVGDVSAQFTANGNVISGITGVKAQGLSFEALATGTATFQVSREELTFQVGANNGEAISTSIGNLTTSNLGIETLTISDKDTANASLSALDTALSTVSTERAKMGATQNRLENTIANLQTQSENLTAANSRIRDLDMASEMAQFTKFQILSQASTAMLAQANQITQGVLSLLR